MAKEKILTKHPLGKSGRNIDRQKYEMIKLAIPSALKNRELTHTELFEQLRKRLENKFSGNISWYGEPLNSSWKPEELSKERLQNLKNIGSNRTNHHESKRTDRLRRH